MARQEQVCCYCGKLKLCSRDHIFGRGLFATPQSMDFSGFTVPACIDCNKGFAADEEYFVNIITPLGLEDSVNAQVLFNTKIRRATMRQAIRMKPLLAEEVFRKMQLVDLHSPTGIYLGRKTKFTIDVEAKKRINRVIEKYARGLFYKHFKEPVPADFRVKVAWPEQAKQMKILKEIKPNGRLGEVVAYGYGQVTGTKNSAWLLVFYTKLPFLVFTVNTDVAPQVA